MSMWARTNGGEQTSHVSAKTLTSFSSYYQCTMAQLTTITPWNMGGASGTNDYKVLPVVANS